MDPDTEPSRAGGDNGASRPIEDNTPADPKPDCGGPDAGKPLSDVQKKIMEMRERLRKKREAEMLRQPIPEVKNIPVPAPPKPDPAKLMRERARRIRRAVRLPEKPPGDAEQALRDQCRMLDALFRQLMMDSAESEAFDEGLGLSLALRTQNQYRHALLALDKIIKSGGFRRGK